MTFSPNGCYQGKKLLWNPKIWQMSNTEMFWNLWVGFFINLISFFTKSWQNIFSLGCLWDVDTWLSSSANAVYISA